MMGRNDEREEGGKVEQKFFLSFSKHSRLPGACFHFPLHKKASNHHANLPLEMYSFTL